MQETQQASIDSNAKPLSYEESRINEFNSIISKGYEESTKDSQAPLQERPEHIPEDFWDKEKKSIKADEELWKKLTSLETQNKALRTKLSRSEKAPPNENLSIEDYQVSLTDEEEVAFGDMLKDTNDPLLNGFKQLCFDEKISKEVFEKVVKGMSSYLKENAEAIANGDHLTEEEKKELDRLELSKLGPSGPAIHNAVESWLRGMYVRNELNSDQVEYLKKHYNNAKGLEILNHLRSKAQTAEEANNISTTKTPEEKNYNDGVPSDLEIQKMFADPKYREDVAFQNKVAKIFEDRQKAGRFPFKATQNYNG